VSYEKQIWFLPTDCARRKIIISKKKNKLQSFLFQALPFFIARKTSKVMCIFQCACVRKKERRKENSRSYFYSHLRKNPLKNDAIDNMETSYCQRSIAQV